ncbi:IPT/TIG domain-containing protein [Legionella bozemanae]|uniref:IPT/TIG domain-containing protein n=1 Tax=Legionella bozemanae TaxID=447 RepID=UPI003EEB9A9A
MQGVSGSFLMNKILIIFLSWLMITEAQAGTPWTFEPLTSTTVAVPANSTATVQYRVTNQSSRPHTLMMQPIQGVAQIATGFGICSNLFMLRSKDSCILSLQINGSQLNAPIVDGPVVCQQGSSQCYRPQAANILRITQAPPITDAVITVVGSPLTLTASSPTGQLTINNTSTEVAATNITSDFTGTALEGNVMETGNTCANVPPGGSCKLTYTLAHAVVPKTNFTIQGTNTNAITAAIAIQSGITLTAITPNSGAASGGTSVTITGTGLTGATGVVFGGIAATNFNVVNSTTITAVTPAHTVGAVDVVINSSIGGVTFSNGYFYVATAAGQPSSGGTIACINGGFQNLIAATADNILAIQWSRLPFPITNAQSDADGATNTATIVTVMGDNGGVPYAAQLCNNYEVDSQGHTPCQAGNTCYNDWFLPAKDQLNCLYINRAAIGGFVSAVGYWSSTEFQPDPSRAWFQTFPNSGIGGRSKDNFSGLRCVRAFTP